MASYYKGYSVNNLPGSLLVYELLKTLPGYTAQTLLAEDADLVEDFLLYRNAEAQAQRS